MRASVPFCFRSTILGAALAVGGCNEASATSDASVRDAGRQARPDAADGDSGVEPSGTRFTWDFEDGTLGAAVPTAAGAIADASGNGVHASAAPGLVYTRAQLEGGVAISLDGMTEGLRAEADVVERVVGVGADEPFVVEVVFRTAYHGRGGGAGAGTLVGYGDPAGTGWQLEVRDGRARFAVSAEATMAEITLDELVSDGRWHRLIAQRTREGELTLSLDGRSSTRGSDATAGLAITAASELRVGAAADGERRFLGDVDRLSFARAVEVPVPADVPEHSGHSSSKEARSFSRDRRRRGTPRSGSPRSSALPMGACSRSRRRAFMAGATTATSRS